MKDWHEDLKIKGKQGLIIGTLGNLFDNAIYWLDFYKVPHKKILIKAYRRGDSTVVLIADNAKGFNISFESALRPFITGRFDDSSMGIGLHLAEQVMLAHGGDITEGKADEEGLPEEFSTGAILKLTFNKE